MPARPARRLLAVALAATTLVGVAACSDDDDPEAGDTTSTTLEHALSDAQALTAATSYADAVLASYSEVVTSAEALKTAIDAFTTAPTDATLEAAKQAWLAGRVLYGPTEVFRFYDGPIDNPEDGPEGQINAWPLDENYIDYVVAEDGTTVEDAGIISDVEDTPEITTDVLVSANEEGGEANISTGWHAIEFLLWGQDLSADGPGARPVTDYTTADHADRRATYLTLLADLLVQDLSGVRDAWEDEAGSYREELLEDPHQAVANVLRGMGALSSAELAGERISVALETVDQEDEHSCFSDNTIVDIIGNATGVKNAYASISAVVHEVDPELDDALTAELAATVDQAEALSGPFDQMILSDNTAGREQLQTLVTALQDQGTSIADLAGELGYSVSLVVE